MALGLVLHMCHNLQVLNLPSSCQGALDPSLPHRGWVSMYPVCSATALLLRKVHGTPMACVGMLAQYAILTIGYR
jgi:hypothetical protein